MLEENVEKMQTAAAGAGKRLRPHAKTHKFSALARKQVEAGARPAPAVQGKSSAMAKRNALPAGSTDAARTNAPLVVLGTPGTIWRYFETWQTDVARTESNELVRVEPRREA